jgi:glycosyltransferase involved in cell wall biosynthesis
MKVTMVTGSYPPDVCGAGDYTARLVSALQGRGVAVDVITGKSWGMMNVPSILRRIAAGRANIVHYQYPTIGYGWKLGPQILALLRRGVVTLHEASETHWMRQLSLIPFLFGKHVIFTNDFERSYVTRFAPWVSKRSSVIPIGSNIPVALAGEKPNDREIVCFGLIRPGKGLESVLELAGILKEQRSKLTIRIVGLPLREHQAYLEDLRLQAAPLPIVWELGLPAETVAERLARATLGYAPIPDGASERRGSLLALLVSGVATVTTRGSQTPAALDDAVVYASSASEAAQVFETLGGDPERRKKLSMKAVRYASRFSWLAIADQHIAVYENVARKPLE